MVTPLDANFTSQKAIKISYNAPAKVLDQRLRQVELA
jgi:hypothetical protein